jgi:septation ring formation regulator EzrA
MLKMKEIAEISQIESFRDYRSLYKVQEEGLAKISDQKEIKQMTKTDLAKTLADLETQLAEIGSELGTIESLKEQADELEATHVVLEGTQKMCSIFFPQTPNLPLPPRHQ